MLCLPVSTFLVRLIAPERCVKSAQTFLLVLLMWQFEGCDYVDSRVTHGRGGGVSLLGLPHEINETKKKHVCAILPHVNVCVRKINRQ